jgi:hypothetical protein
MKKLILVLLRIKTLNQRLLSEIYIIRFFLLLKNLLLLVKFNNKRQMFIQMTFEYCAYHQ